MRPKRFAHLGSVFAIGLMPLAPPPAAAERQSSDSSSNGSNGRGTRIERLVIEDRAGRRGDVTRAAWREDARRGGLPARRWSDDDD